MEKEYTYGVARIRAMETSLFDNAVIEQLLQCKDYYECIDFLRGKGWGSGNVDESLEDMLEAERSKTDSVLKELVGDKSDYRILTVADEFQNLKAAIKQVCTENKIDNIFVNIDEKDREQLKNIILQGNFDLLPEGMSDVAKEATDVLLKTGDGQMCDVIIDTATLEEIKSIGEKSESSFVKDYAEALLTVTNIKVAIRCALTGKDSKFADKAIVSCSGINKTELVSLVENGIGAVCSYLEDAGYKEAVMAFQKSNSVFECWCDNKIISGIISQKYESFTVGPILAYVLARKNEIKTVRIILQGKLNGFENDFIKERIRIMYA